MSLNPAKSTEYVNFLLNEIKTFKLEDDLTGREAQLEKLKNKFPRGGVQAILEKNPDLLDKGNVLLVVNLFSLTLRLLFA